MMHILAIDTSANFVTCGIVAVQPNGYPTVVASVETDNARGHMELLVPQIQQCLQQANIEPHHLHAVVVGVGPGPFTGLRVGMATGMAYADALGVPVHGVSSLEATAWSAVVKRSFIAGQSLDITVIADARRSEWYAARYRFSAPRNGAVGITRATVLAPHVDRPEAVVATLANESAVPAEDHLVRAGAGVQTTVEAHVQEALPNLPVAEGHPTVAGLVMAALHQEHGFMGLLRTPQPVRAHYLRRPDAVVPKLPNTSAALDMAAVAQQDLAVLQRFDVEGDGGGAEPLPQLTGCYVAPLGFEHADAVAALERSIFAEESPWTSDMIAQGIATPYVSALGVFEDGNLLGYAFHSMLGHISEPECELQNIAIDPAHRGRGLAHLLLEPLIEIADRTGATCFLEVRTDNTPAIALYERYGFTIIDTRTNYYQPSGADAYVMQRPKLQQPRNVAEVASDTQSDTQHDESAQPQLILGIESSCDETGVGIINRGDYTVLADAVASSMNEHARFGGVVPEIASRAHLESMQPVMRAALEEASIAKPDAVAATIGPGLAGALLVGAAAAKAYAAAWEVPFYAVNHLGGHVAVDTLVEGVTADKLDNAIALLVSGGHTQILHVQGVGKPMREMGSTLDDAAGEAYDKVARLLGLGYPGGPIIDQLAAKGDATAIRFPRGMMRQQDARYDFSFSGVKTAVARFVEAAERAGETIKIEDVCASFQEAVVEVLVVKALRACADTGAAVLLLGGGVSANRRLREFAAQACEAAGVELHVPPLRLCTDNGVMIAALAAHLIDAGHEASDLSVATDPALEVEVPLV